MTFYTVAAANDDVVMTPTMRLLLEPPDCVGQEKWPAKNGYPSVPPLFPPSLRGRLFWSRNE
jgi:hypothetical protein